MPVIPSPSSGDAMPKWFLLANGFSQHDLLVLTETDTNSGPDLGVQLTIAPIKPGSRGQLWRAQLTNSVETMLLYNGLGNSLVLSFQGSCQNGAPAVVYPSQQNSYTVPNNISFQLWSPQVDGEVSIGQEVVRTGLIGNFACHMFLSAQGSAAGSPVALSNARGPGSQWFTWPNYPLDIIMAAPTVPFPQGSGPNESEQQKAYQQLSADLGYGTATCTMAGVHYTGVRCAYTNLSLDWTTLSLTFISTNIYADSEDANAFTLAEEWRRQRDLDRHLRSDEFAAVIGASFLLAHAAGISLDLVSRQGGAEEVLRRRMEAPPARRPRRRKTPRPRRRDA